MIKIARDGIEIGVCEPQELENLITQDVVRTTDHFWKTGMKEWRPVSEILSEFDTLKKQKKLYRIKLAVGGILIVAVLAIASIFSKSALDDFRKNAAKTAIANSKREADQKVESDRRTAIARLEYEAAASREREAEKLAGLKALKEVNLSIDTIIGEFIVSPPDKFKKGSLAWYTHKNAERYWSTNLRVHLNENGYFYFETILKGYFDQGHSIIRHDSFVLLFEGNTINSGLGEADEDVEISGGTFFERVSYNSDKHQELARLIADACARGTKLELRMNGRRGKFRDVELTSEDALAFSQSIKLADLLTRKKILSGK